MFFAGDRLFFVCTLIGAAIIGAMIAGCLFLFFCALISFGFLSAAVAVGLSKRSLSAGFQPLLLLVFGSACSFLTGSSHCLSPTFHSGSLAWLPDWRVALF